MSSTIQQRCILHKIKACKPGSNTDIFPWYLLEDVICNYVKYIDRKIVTLCRPLCAPGVVPTMTHLGQWLSIVDPKVKWDASLDVE